MNPKISLTLNADDMKVFFHTKQEFTAFKVSERRACSKEYKALWIAIAKEDRAIARKALCSARIKFAKNRGLQVVRVRE